MTRSKRDSLADLLSSIDELIILWATGEDDRKVREKIIRSRREVGEVVASNDQLLIVLEQQIKTLFARAGIVNERDLCQALGCSKTWLWAERKAGRWLNFEVDARGARHYTPEQILANLRGEKSKEVA
jgi:hypothetical protein